MYLRHIDVNIVLWAAVVCEQYSPDLTRISNCECFFQHYSVCRQLERIDVGRLFFSRNVCCLHKSLCIELANELPQSLFSISMVC